MNQICCISCSHEQGLNFLTHPKKTNWLKTIRRDYKGKLESTACSNLSNMHTLQRNLLHRQQHSEQIAFSITIRSLNAPQELFAHSFKSTPASMRSFSCLTYPCRLGSEQVSKGSPEDQQMPQLWIQWLRWVTQWPGGLNIFLGWPDTSEYERKPAITLL